VKGPEGEAEDEHGAALQLVPAAPGGQVQGPEGEAVDEHGAALQQVLAAPGRQVKGPEGEAEDEHGAALQQVLAAPGGQVQGPEGEAEFEHGAAPASRAHPAGCVGRCQPLRSQAPQILAEYTISKTYKSDLLTCASLPYTTAGGVAAAAAGSPARPL
jgi:hypothetical protein